ncbi:MAG: hypothetical protein ACP5RN_06855 [Armatimonadota bacterium]
MRIGIVDLDTSHPPSWIPIERELGHEIAGVRAVVSKGEVSLEATPGSPLLAGEEPGGRYTLSRGNSYEQCGFCSLPCTYTDYHQILQETQPQAVYIIFRRRGEDDGAGGEDSP